jgi:AcrR family transcriptional regulator
MPVLNVRVCHVKVRSRPSLCEDGGMTPPPSPAERKQPEQRRSRERVERILDEAAALISETGVDGMTMSALAETAGVSLPSIYRYFASKQAIIERLALRYAERVRVALMTAMEPVDTPADARAAVAEAMGIYWRLYRDDPTFAAVWSATIADPALAALDIEDSRHNGRLLADAIADVADPGGTDPDLLAFVASHLAGSVVRLAVQLDATEADAVIDAMVERVLPALLGLTD